MKKPKAYLNHTCAPKDWRQTSDMTGSYEMDAVIQRCKNPDMRDRLADHLLGDQAYGRKTAYNSQSRD